MNKIMLKKDYIGIIEVIEYLDGLINEISVSRDEFENDDFFEQWKNTLIKLKKFEACYVEEIVHDKFIDLDGILVIYDNPLIYLHECEYTILEDANGDIEGMV